MNPLRKQLNVTDKDGKLHPLKLELADFSLAQREIGVKLTPFGDTEFWRGIDEDPVHANLVLLYVGLRRTTKPGSLDALIDLFPTELLLGPVAQVMGEAMEDFSQRLGRIRPSEAEPEILPATGTCGPSPSLTLVSTPTSSGA